MHPGVLMLSCNECNASSLTMCCVQQLARRPSTGHHHTHGMCRSKKPPYAVHVTSRCCDNHENNGVRVHLQMVGAMKMHTNARCVLSQLHAKKSLSHTPRCRTMQCVFNLQKSRGVLLPPSTNQLNCHNRSSMPTHTASPAGKGTVATMSNTTLRRWSSTQSVRMKTNVPHCLLALCGQLCCRGLQASTEAACLAFATVHPFVHSFLVPMLRLSHLSPG